MIFTYNKEHVGDVLMVIVKDSKGAKLDYERKGNVSRVFLEKNGETVAHFDPRAAVHADL